MEEEVKRGTILRHKNDKFSVLVIAPIEDDGYDAVVLTSIYTRSIISVGQIIAIGEIEEYYQVVRGKR